MDSDAQIAYDALAPFYDQFTDGYAHTALVSSLVALARDHGLEGDRALDVACGTGKSTAPLLDLGYDVSCCDASPGMAAEASRRLGAAAQTFVADMRSLPDAGAFDLVTCVDDSVNYLLSDADLRRALRSMAARLRPGGYLVFDTNTIGTYRRGFSSDFVRDGEAAVFCWRGHASSRADRDTMCSATIEVFDRRADGAFDRVTSNHRQRHFSPEAIRAAVTAAGLRLRAVRGLLAGGELSPAPSEEEQPKAVYLVSRGD